MGRRNPVTGQSVLMTEIDAESHRKFIAEYVASLKPDGIHAVEENIFALGHSEP
jgi:hypothetical protein